MNIKVFWRTLFLLMAALLVGSLARAATIVESAVVQFRVESLGTAGETRIISAVGVQLNAEGFVLTTASPFSQTGASSRVRIFSVSGASSKYIRPLELLLVDQQADIAVLRAASFSRPSTHLQLPPELAQFRQGTVYFSVEFGEASNEGKLPREVELLPVAPNTLQTQRRARVEVGSPVATEDGMLVGLVGGVNPDGTVRMLPLSTKSIPPSVYATFSADVQVSPDFISGQRTMTVPLTETQNIHVAGTTLRRYQRRIEAPSGARIVKATFSVDSANKLRDGPAIQISPDSRVATVSFSLESGPLWDRWRGWLSGEVRLVLDTQR